MHVGKAAFVWEEGSNDGMIDAEVKSFRIQLQLTKYSPGGDHDLWEREAH